MSDDRRIATVCDSLREISGAHRECLGAISLLERRLLSPRGDRFLKKLNASVVAAYGVASNGSPRSTIYAEWGRLMVEFGAQTDLKCGVLARVLEGLIGASPATHASLLWSARWCRLGLPTVRLTDMQAAAFALTDAPQETHSRAIAPWPAFLVEIEGDGLCETDDGRVRQVRIQRSDTHLDTWGGWSIQADVGSHTLSNLWKTTDQLASSIDGVRQDGNLIEQSGIDSRAIEVLGRFAVGTVLAVNSREWTVSREPNRKRRVGALPHELVPKVFTIGAPVVVDLRQHVSDYVSGHVSTTRKSRWVVRGHWRNQPCGQGLLERRLTWVRPHWRGPALAPALIREHHISKDGAS